MTYSKHYTEDRKAREEIIKTIGEGQDIAKVVWYHEGRKQIHVITDNGIVKVYNAYTGLLITKLIARPNQIKRYFRNGYNATIKAVIEIAYEHQVQGLNNK